MNFANLSFSSFLLESFFEKGRKMLSCERAMPSIASASSIQCSNSMVVWSPVLFPLHSWSYLPTNHNKVKSNPVFLLAGAVWKYEQIW